MFVLQFSGFSCVSGEENIHRRFWMCYAAPHKPRITEATRRKIMEALPNEPDWTCASFHIA